MARMESEDEQGESPDYSRGYQDGLDLAAQRDRLIAGESDEYRRGVADAMVEG